MSISHPPTFIVGIARSGTSALYLALQKHAAFVPTRSPHGFDLTESRVFLHPASVRSSNGPAWNFLLRDADVHHTLARQLNRIHRRYDAVHTHPRLGPLFSKRASTRLIWWKLCRRDALLRAYFTHAAEARGAVRLVEKTPDHLYRLHEIRATFPAARILCTMRHPLDVFSSYRRRLAAAEKTEPADSSVLRWLKEMDASSFIRYYRSAAAEAARAHHVLVVRYEEFTHAPAVVFQHVCDFLGEPFDVRCIQQDTPVLRSYTQDLRLALPIEPNDKRWTDHITPEEAHNIQAALDVPMRQLGYEYRT